MALMLVSQLHEKNVGISLHPRRIPGYNLLLFFCYAILAEIYPPQQEIHLLAQGHSKVLNEGLSGPAAPQTNSCPRRGREKGNDDF